MITSKQRSYLRGLANTIDPILQVGKGGINENMIIQFTDALEARELIKSSVLNNSSISTKDICNELAIKTESDIVQIIGNKFVLYKESKKNKTIVLPKK